MCCILWLWHLLWKKSNVDSYFRKLCVCILFVCHLLISSLVISISFVPLIYFFFSFFLLSFTVYGKKIRNRGKEVINSIFFYFMEHVNMPHTFYTMLHWASTVCFFSEGFIKINTDKRHYVNANTDNTWFKYFDVSHIKKGISTFFPIYILYIHAFCKIIK